MRATSTSIVRICRPEDTPVFNVLPVNSHDKRDPLL